MKSKFIWLVPMAALAVALLHMPYGYYMLLRLLVCGVCAYLSGREADSGRTEWAWILGGCAVLYNPILPIHLNREMWSVINVATIALFAVHFWLTGRAKRQLPTQ